MDEFLSLKWKNHTSTFLQVLSFIRKDLMYSDVTLTCSGKFYSAHKMVLTACSDYFREIFEYTDCKKPVIVLKDIKCEDLETLLDYMYLGEVNVKQADITSLINAAECLQIKGLAVADEIQTKSIHLSSKERLLSPTIKCKRKPTEASPQFTKQFRGSPPFMSVNEAAISSGFNKVKEQTDEKPPFIKKELSETIDIDNLSFGEFDSCVQDDNNTNSNSYLTVPSKTEVQDSYLQTGQMEPSSSFQDIQHCLGEESYMDYPISTNEYDQANTSSQPNKIKGLQCDICRKKFQFPSQYRIHMRKHTGEKPFSCPSCDYKSTMKRNLKVHMLLIHK